MDVPVDESKRIYCKLRDDLEHPDGSMRHEQATFFVLPLESAMKNVHHDAPGFWEAWAEKF